MQPVAKVVSKTNRHFAPILDDSGNFPPNAFLILQGLMLFPDNPVSAAQFGEIILLEARIGIHQIVAVGADEEDDIEMPLPVLSFMAEKLRKEARKRHSYGSIAGSVALCLIRLDDHAPKPSIRKASALVGLRQFAACNTSTADTLGETAKKHFQHFRAVAHFWAAWSLLDARKKTLVSVGGVLDANATFRQFLVMAAFFERRLTIFVADSNVPILGVPAKFIVRSYHPPSDPLDEETLRFLATYRVHPT
jgi:hypothetical protein